MFGLIVLRQLETRSFDVSAQIAIEAKQTGPYPFPVHALHREADPPQNTASISVVVFDIGNKRTTRVWRNIHDRFEIEADPVGRPLNRISFRSIPNLQRGNPLPGMASTSSRDPSSGSDSSRV